MIRALLSRASATLSTRRVAVEMFAGPVVVVAIGALLGAVAGVVALYWLGELLWWAGVRV